MYNFKLFGQTYQVNDEQELALIFDIIRKTSTNYNSIQKNIILDLGENLGDIIITYKGLLNCLKYLGSDSQFFLLIQLGDTLSNILENSYQLAEILARLYTEKDKIRLLKTLRLKGLKKLIKNTKDLGNIFEFLYDEGDIELINILGTDFIREVFLSTYEIVIILYYLNNEAKDKLIDILGIQNIKNKIKTSKNLLVMIKGLTDKKAKELLQIYKKEEILDLFNDDKDFNSFFLRLSSSKEKIFLNYLKK